MADKSRKGKDTNPGVSVNKKAYYNYELAERFEAGIALTGSEVKSLRCGRADLSGSYGRISKNECWLVGANIAPYAQAGLGGHEPLRRRKLLFHKSEIRKIKGKLDQRGFTLVPLKIYFNQRGLAKVELALARGKRKYDKRRAITQRQQKKDIDSSTKKYRR